MRLRWKINSLSDRNLPSSRVARGWESLSTSISNGTCTPSGKEENTIIFHIPLNPKCVPRASRSLPTTQTCGRRPRGLRYRGGRKASDLARKFSHFRFSDDHLC